MNTVREARCRQAFTLIEVLLAIALLLVLSAGVFGYVWGLLSRQEQVEAEADRQAAAGAVFEAVQSALTTTYVVDGGGKPGIQGKADSLVVRGRGIDAGVGPGAQGIGDDRGAELRFDVEAGMLAGRRLGRSTGEYEVIGERIECVRVRYFDGREWVGAFDSREKRSLPAAVEVALWFQFGEGGVGTSAAEAEGSEGRVSPATPGRSDGGEDRVPASNADEAASDTSVEPPQRAPDRVRIMVIPDGPGAAWKERS